MKKSKKLIICILCILLVIAAVFIFTAPVWADTSGNVAGAIENTWRAMRGQIRTIVDNVIFPAIALILAILLFTKIAMAYMDYRKHGQFEFTAPAILFACLVFVITAPLYLWAIVGM